MRATVAFATWAALAACSSDEPKNVPVPVHRAGKPDAIIYVTSSEWNIVVIILTQLEAEAPGARPAHAADILGPRPVGPASRPLGVAARSSGDSIEVTGTITGPPQGTTFQFLTHGAFDASGNLWISAGNSSLQGSVIEYTAAQQTKGGALSPAVAIGGLQIPEGIAFDEAGNLWVVDFQADALLEYTAVQLASSGSPTPATSVSLAGMTLGGASYNPRELAFDKAGNAWVSFIINFATRPSGISVDSIPNDMVAQFPASSLTSSGTPSPSIMLRPTGAALNTFVPGYGGGLAIDSAGNLWTANTGPANVSEFSAASLVAGANPAPTVTLTDNWASDEGLIGIGFDSSGELLVATGQALFAYQASQIAQSGSPTPDITLPNSTPNPLTGVIGGS